MARKVKIMENEKHTLQNVKYARNTEKLEKLDTQYRTWNMARKLNDKENEKLTWQDQEYVEKH